MKAYKLYNRDSWGSEYDEIYSINYSKITQLFNDRIREAIKEIGSDIASIDDFREEILSIKENNKYREACKHAPVEILCRKYPILITKDCNMIIANIYYWERTSHEYSEYDVESNTIIIEEIDVIE